MIATNPRFHWVDVTPSDSVNFVSAGKGSSAEAIMCDAFYIGGAGNIVVVRPDLSTTTIAAIAGAYLWIRGIRVNATSTTATGIKALYAL